MTIQWVCNAVAIGLGLVSSALWLWSAFAKVRFVQLYRPDGSPIGAIVEDGIDLMRSLKRQSRLSGLGAMAASGAALAQVIGFIFS